MIATEASTQCALRRMYYGTRPEGVTCRCYGWPAPTVLATFQDLRADEGRKVSSRSKNLPPEPIRQCRVCWRVVGCLACNGACSELQLPLVDTAAGCLAKSAARLLEFVAAQCMVKGSKEKTCRSGQKMLLVRTCAWLMLAERVRAGAGGDAVRS